MKQFSSKLKSVLLFALIIFSSNIIAQTTISTQVGSTNYSSNNNLSGNCGITFVVENNSGGPINLTQVNTSLFVANNGMIPGLWYSSTALGGATPVVATPDWTLITTGTAVTVNTDGFYDLFSGLSLQIPNNTQYRFAIQSSNGIRYSGTGLVPIPTPSSFSSSGVTLKVGDVQIAGLNVGYNVQFPAGTMPNTPRYFTGSITFENALPCIAPPTGGTTISSQAFVCPSFNFNLSLTGQSTGTGQTFQWQSSPDNITYTDIVGETNVNLTTNQLSATYYRNKLTCSGQQAFSTPVLVGILPVLNTGTYTINKNLPTSGSNYNSFTDALAGLACGISGAVTFNVDSASGPYVGQVNFGQIAGADATNTVSFNGNGALLINSSSLISNRHVVQLNGTDYLTFSDFNIQVPDTSVYGWGIHVINDANFNTISNNSIKLNLIQTTTNFAGIVFSGSTTSASTATIANSNLVENNTISGGYYGLILNGATGLVGVGQNTIRNNKIMDFYLYGIYLSNNDSTNISGNNISRKLRNNGGTFYGIYLVTANSNTLIDKNIIHDTHTTIGASTSLVAGIYLTGSDALVGESNMISNNLIHTLNTNGLSYGMYNSSSDNALYYHNTVAVNSLGSTAGDSRGFYQTTLATGIELKNNIFNVQKGGSGVEHALYFNTPTSTILSDNNALYADTLGAGLAFIGNLGGTTNNFKTIELWRASGAGVFDLASVSADPQFNSPIADNFIPTSAIINNIGTPIGTVIDDIFGVIRDVNTPDPGSYEFSPATVDAGLTFVNEPIAPCTGSANVKVTLKNFGIDPLTSVTVNWSVNNISQTPYSFAGTLLTSEDTIVTIGNLNIVANVLYSIKAWTSAPNGLGDANAANDTIIKSGIRSSLQGIYTIGGVGANYSTIANAAADLNNFGVCAPVVFNINPAAGPYTDRIQVNAIIGASSINTVTFNGNGALIQYLPLTTESRAAVQLNGADWVTIDSVTIQVDSTTWGWGLHLTQSANNNQLINSTISLTQNSTSSNFAGIVVAGSNTSIFTAGAANNNSFINNEINGGYYGATIVGATGVVDVKNNSFTKNRINNFHFYGIYMSNNDSTTVSENDISRLTRSNLTTFYGIHVTTASNNLRIFNNKIHDSHTALPTSIAAAYGINFSFADAIVGKENLVYNNLIYKLNNSGTTNGILNTSADNARYYFNTIALEADGFTAAGDVRGFYQTTAVTGVEFKNNIVSITKGGSGAKQALFFNTAASSIISENNGLYVNAPGSNVEAIGNFAGANFTTLADWKLANGGFYDLLSASSNPQFASIINSDFKPSASAFNNIALPIVGISTDINGVLRNNTNPDAGAYEFSPVALDVGLSAFVQPKFPCEGLNSVAVRLTNFGLSPITSATINWTLNNVAQTPFNYAGNLGSGLSDTILLGSFTIVGNNGYNLQASTFSPNGTTDANLTNDTVRLLNLKASLNGIFAIGGSGADYLTIGAAATDLTTRGVCGPVVFNVNNSVSPYVEQIQVGVINGSSATNTVIFNGNGSTVTFAPTINNKHLLKLDGSDYVTFDNFTLSIEDTATFGWGVHLLNGADYNKISNSKIMMSKSSTSSVNSAGIVASGSSTSLATATNASFNEFSNNEITGGYHGIRLNGNTGSIGSLGNKIANNIFSDFNLYGIFLLNTDSTNISENDFSRPTRLVLSTFYGVFNSTGAINSLIYKNKVHDPFGTNNSSTSLAYGIYFSADAPLGKENKVYNNLIYNFKSNGTQGGIFTTGSDGVWASFNTISLDDTNSTVGTTYGIYQSTVSTNLDFRNNIVSIKRTGTGVKTGLFYNTNTSTINSSNNNIYVDTTSGGTHYYGRWGTTNSVSLLDFQTASSLELASLETNPNLASASILVPQLGSAVVNAGIPISYIQDDFIGILRNASSPTIGAYEEAREAVPPTIAFADLSDTFILTNRVLANFATINDPAGVDTSSLLRPRLYFKKALDNNTFAGNTNADNGWKYVLANTSTPAFSFTIDYSLLTSVIAIGEEIQYFVVAQDLSPIANVGSFSGNLSGNPLSVELLANNFPLTGTIKSFEILPVPPNNDLAVIEFLRPSSNQCGNIQDSITLVISNVGLTAQSNFGISVYVSGAINDTLNTIYTASLGGQTSDTVSIGFLNTNINGIVELNGIISLVGDANALNDSLLFESAYSETPNTPLVLGDTVCPGQTATLIADGGLNQINWFNALNSTIPIFVGDTLLLTSVSASQTYFAESSSDFNYSVGPLNNSFGTFSAQTPFSAGIVFDVLNENKLDSVAVFVATSGIVNIELRNSSGVVLASASKNMIASASKQFIALNFSLNPGIGYRLVGAAGSTATIQRNDLGTSSFPYTSNSIVLTGSTLSTFYYYFYDWKYTATGCISTRIPVGLTVNPAPLVNLGPNQSVCVGGTTNLDAGNVGSTYLWSTGATTQTISITTAGTYSVTVTSANLCSSSDAITITIEQLPIVNLGVDVSICNGESIILDAGNAGSTYLWSTGATTQTISVNTAGTYSVTVTSLAGCSSSDAIVVSSAGALPIVNLGADISTCASVITVLDAGNSGSTYLWSTGATTQTISVNIAGTYSVTVTNAGGCSATDAILVSQFVAANASFTATQAAGSRVVTFAPSVVTGTHEWDFGNGVGTSILASPAYNYVVNGVYLATHIITTADNCKDTSEVTVTVTTPVGISEPFISAFSYQIYPNPIQTETRISYELKERSLVQVNIYDVLGRIVLQPVNATQSIGKHEVLVNTDMLQNGSGVYEIQLIVNGQSETLRLVKVE